MTTVLKAGGSSVADGTKISRILKQAQGLDDLIVLTVSAQGKTTNRIEKSIESAKNGEAVPEPEEIFQEFESLCIGNRNLTANGIRDSIYAEFRSLQKPTPEKLRQLEDPSYTAKLHLDGERLAAIGVCHIAQCSGLNPLCVDLIGSRFPLAVKGDYHAGRIDLEESRKRAQQVLSSVKHGILILPGYGGLDLDRKGPNRIFRMKTLGRGGSDTAAFGYLYAFQGDRLLILTDVYGILNAAIEGGETVPVLDIEEAKDAASLGAKLPGRRALRGLEKCYEEGGNPEVYIAHSQDFAGPRTRIVKETEEKVPVKLVAGRDVVIYSLEGDIRGLQNVLANSGVDWAAGPLTDDYARVAVSQETDSYAERLITGHRRQDGKNGRRMSKEGNLAFVGAVGSGMYNTQGIVGRAGTALGRSGIGVEYNMDPGKVSLGYIIGRNDTTPALVALHGEFLPP